MKACGGGVTSVLCRPGLVVILGLVSLCSVCAPFAQL